MPWITDEMKELMQKRDNLKENSKTYIQETREQQEVLNLYKKQRNKVNNKMKQEEVKYKKNEIAECQDLPSQTWHIAKQFMGSKQSSGSSTQLEIEEGNKINLVTKAKDIAHWMNSFFTSKVQKIVLQLNNIGEDFDSCNKSMQGRKLLCNSATLL